MMPHSRLPVAEMSRLAHLIPGRTGTGTFWPPTGEALAVRASISGYWEESERFLRLEYGHEDELGTILTIVIVGTYSETSRKYRFWSFSASHEEPVAFYADFQGDSLIADSLPVETAYGTQKMRVTWTSFPEDTVSLVVECWTPQGFVRMLDVALAP